MPTRSAARIARARLAFAFDADRRAGLDRGLELVVALARAGEVHRNAGELGLLQPLQLAARDDAEAVDISAKEFEQRLVRVCGDGIMKRDAVGHRALEAGDLRADDIVVIDEQRRAAGFGDQLLGGIAADQQLAVVVGGEMGRDRSGRLHSRSPL